uniref:Uncharacterized protein n=1 Tax=Romanomermis culicivorax TaxID=13658 RepID=A0A915KP83_ROMCU
MKANGQPDVQALDAEAERVECAVNTLVSIPERKSTALSHLEMVVDETDFPFIKQFCNARVKRLARNNA